MKVKDICDLHNGRAFKPGDWGSEGLPIIRIQNLNDEKAPFNYFSGEHSPVHEINDGDLLFSWSGTPGTSFGAFRWRRGKGVLNQHIFKILPKIEVDKEYLKYALNGNINTIIAKAHGGVGLQHITKKELDEIDIPIIALPDQLKAVDRISSAEKMIAMRKLELQKLDELVKARFVEMFGEPLINTKGWGTRPIVEVAPIKPLHGNLSDKVWLLNLDAIESQTGNVLFKQRVRSAEINASTVYFTTENILYSKLRPYLNKVVMPDEDGIATSELIPMCPQADKLDRTYLCYWLRSDAFVKHISEKVAGAKMPRVSMDYFRTMSIELPPIKLQEQFASFVEQADRSKAVVQKSLDKAQLLFDSLMQEFFG